MGFFKKLFGSHEEQSSTATLEPPVCPHVTLTPRWESVDDMGNDDLATGYTCEGCGEQFSPAEGHELQRHQAERVREISATE